MAPWNVDFAVGAARQIQLFGEFELNAVVRQADRAKSVNRAIEKLCKSCRHRIGLAGTAEKLHLDAVPEVLIGEQRQMQPGFHRLSDSPNRIGPD